MSKAWIDVSVPLKNGMVHWPDDEPFHRSDMLQISRGDPCNLSKFAASAHIGTHMDAPRHYLDGAAGIESLPLSAVIGPARVIGIKDPDLIRIPELQPYSLAQGERVLFKTRNSVECWKRPTFQEKFVFIPKETAAYLAERRVQTVGVDYLSVGGYEIDGPETHRALLQAGIWIIEGLNLEQVEPGDYDMICLPLKMIGSDGAPARAVLRPRR